jgi:hypothetical protein
MNTTELRRLALEACENEDPADYGSWELRGNVTYILPVFTKDEARPAPTVTLTYTCVEPAWSDGDVRVLVEMECHAAYIAAANPAAVVGLLDELDRLRAFVEWAASLEGLDYNRIPAGQTFALSAKQFREVNA